MMRAVLEAARHAEDFELTARVVRLDGSIRHVVSRGRPELNQDGGLVGFFGIILDLTEIYQAQEALAHRESENILFRQMIESIADPILAKDREGRFLSCQRGGARGVWCRRQRGAGRPP